MKTGRPSGAVARAYAATSEEYPGRSTLYAGHNAFTRRPCAAPKVGSAPDLTPVKSVEWTTSGA